MKMAMTTDGRAVVQLEPDDRDLLASALTLGNISLDLDELLRRFELACWEYEQIGSQRGVYVSVEGFLLVLAMSSIRV